MNPRKLEHGFRRISAGIPYTLFYGHEANNVPTSWDLVTRVINIVTILIINYNPS